MPKVTLDDTRLRDASLTAIHPSCGAMWAGMNTAHCAGCHMTFSGLVTFSAHRAGGKCSTDLPALGMVQGLRTYPCWGYPYAVESETA